MTDSVVQHESLPATSLILRSSFVRQDITRSGPLRNSETRNSRTVLRFDTNGS